MTKTAENNKRIAKNAGMLYVRMLLIMGIMFYTSRVVLDVLGVNDFGIYNVVGGIVVLFTFVNNVMVSSTQRFLNYALGSSDEEKATRIFSAALRIHIVIAVLLLVLAETVGLWFFFEYIQIPPGRGDAALWAYQMSILLTCVSIVRTPYNAAVIANEHMSFFAFITVLDAVFKLLAVYGVLVLGGIDRLISYSVIMLFVGILVFAVYVAYCRTQFQICRGIYVADRSLYKQLLNFSGWSLFGGVATMGANQGLSILMNMFFGVVVNAAMGIAHQVNNAVYTFATNFQTVLNPQIVKAYAAGNRDYFIQLVTRTSRYSYYLLYIIALPVLVCIAEYLDWWLPVVPEHAVWFCRLTILYSLIDAMQSPLWISVQATGRIKNYQILMSVLFISTVPISYICLRFGAQPEIVLFVRVLVNLVVSAARLLYLRQLYGFPVRRYVMDICIHCGLVTVLTFPVMILLYENIPHSFMGVVGMTFLSFFFTAFFILICGLRKDERRKLLSVAIHYCSALQHIQNKNK